MVGKVLAYEDAGGGDWRSRVLALAGSGEPDFARLSEDCLAMVPEGFSLGRIYANESSDLVQLRSQVASAFETGAFLVHYVGHGLVNQWDQQDVLPPATIAGLDNGQRLPVVLSATCLDGYHLTPTGEASRADALLGADGGGAVACFSSTGMSKAEAKDPLVRAFYEEIFSPRAGLRLGDVTLGAKVAYLSNVVDREAVVATHTLFGDPSMLLVLPMPAAPTNLRLRLLGGDAVELSWDAPETGFVAGYVVERQDGPQAGMVRINGETVATTIYVDHVLSGVPTSYRVRALSSTGAEGPASEQVSTLVVLPGGETDGGGDGGGGGGCAMDRGGAGVDLALFLSLLIGWAWLGGRRLLLLDGRR